MLLSKREFRIVWGFLFLATVSEIIAVAWLFQPTGPWIKSLLRYCTNPPGTPLAWALAVAVMAAYFAYSASRSPIIRLYAFNPASWTPFLAVRLFAIPMAFVTGFFEEAFFRKSVMDIALQHGYGNMLQVLVSALVFGMVHAIWSVFGGRFRAAFAVMIATTLLGGLLAVVYVIGNRSVGPCIAAHIALNLLLEPWMIISSATGSWGKRSAGA